MHGKTFTAKHTLKAIRGAVCSTNDKAEITERTLELYDRILKVNEFCETDILSIFFSITPDIKVLNPANALRQSGRAGETAMMVLEEAVLEDSLPGTIRVLIHAYMADDKPVHHIYIRGAEKLRPDRSD